MRERVEFNNPALPVRWRISIMVVIVPAVVFVSMLMDPKETGTQCH